LYKPRGACLTGPAEQINKASWELNLSHLDASRDTELVLNSTDIPLVHRYMQLACQDMKNCSMISQLHCHCMDGGNAG